MNRKIKFVGILTMSLLVGCGQVKEAETEVATSSPEWEQTIDVDGKVEAIEREEIYLGFPAKIKAIHIKDGDIVNKGDALFTLDTTDYEETIEEKEGEIAVLQAELDALRNPKNALIADLQYAEKQIQVKKQERDNEDSPELKKLKNNITLLNEEISSLKADYETHKQLSEVGGTSEKSLQDIKDKISAKQKEIENAEHSIAEHKKNIDLEMSKLESQKQSLNLQMSESDRANMAQMKVLQVKIDNANAQLTNLKQKYKTVTLSKNKLLSQKDQLLIYDIQGYVGSQIAANSQLLARCANLNSIVVSVDVPVEDLLRVKIGDKVTIKAYNEQTEDIEGTISHLSNHAIDKEGDSYIEAEVEVTKGKELLQVDAKIDGTIYLSE